MKRDMDLVRLLLIEAEKAEGPVDIRRFVCDKYGLQQIAYHVELLQAFGLVDARVDRAWEGAAYTGGHIDAVTWAGCDFLDAIRNERIWERTKRAVRDTVGDTTLDVFKRTAVAVAVKMIEAGL